MRIVFAALLLLCSFAATADELPDYAAIPHIDRYATRAEYDEARADTRFRLTRAGYDSDGVKVFAYVYAPAAKPEHALPVVIFNRGSYTWKEFAGEYLTTWHRLAVAGFVVIAPMLRGSGGAEGRDGQRHQRGGGGLERGQAQAAAAQAGDRLQLGLGLAQAGEDGVGMAHERLAGLRQPHPAGAALNEDGARLALQRGDLLGHGRLGEGERLRGGRERAADRDLPRSRRTTP